MSYDETIVKNIGWHS